MDEQRMSPTLTSNTNLFSKVDFLGRITGINHKRPILNLFESPRQNHASVQSN